MEKRALMIGNLKSYMVGAARKAIENQGVEVVRADVSVNSVDTVRKDESIFIYYLSDAEDVKDDLLVYLKDLVSEGSIYLFVVANPMDNDEVRRRMPDSKRIKYFERPLNAEIFNKALVEAFETVEKEHSKKRILVVDDNAVSLRAMKEVLSGKFSVSIVNSGVSAITFLTKNEVDLILLDYEMPVVSGPQVLEMIKEEPSIEAPPVMFLTSRNDAQSVKTALALKPVKYLLKSLPSSELVDTIVEYFESKK